MYRLLRHDRALVPAGLAVTVAIAWLYLLLGAGLGMNAVPMVGGAILVAAGLYQWTPLKQACLVGCRSPLEFLMRYWRVGYQGAVGCGIRPGAFCLGCCWMLMAVLFVGGLMNLLWIAGLALLVLVEKTVPWGIRASRLSGAALALWGMAMLAAGVYP